MKRLVSISVRMIRGGIFLCLCGASSFLSSLAFAACQGEPVGQTTLGPVCASNTETGYKPSVGGMPVEAAQVILLQHVVDAIKSLETKIAGLNTAVATLQTDHTKYKTTTDNELKTWKDTTLTDAITKIGSIPAGVATNADFRSAALEALKADLTGNQEFLDKLKAAIKP